MVTEVFVNGEILSDLSLSKSTLIPFVIDPAIGLPGFEALCLMPYPKQREL